MSDPTTSENPDIIVQLNSQIGALKESVEKLHFNCNKTTLGKDYISLSVQGSIFVLQRDFVVSQNWMVTKMMTSEIPCPIINGCFYLDVDQVSFRLIVRIPFLWHLTLLQYQSKEDMPKI
jgi:hypothetical protein